jgi:hypothetical protein
MVALRRCACGRGLRPRRDGRHHPMCWDCEQVADRGSTTCECGNAAATLGACARCEYLDGGKAEGVVVGALRTMGGVGTIETLLLEVSEPDDEGSRERYIRRAIAKLRASGRVIARSQPVYARVRDDARGIGGVDEALFVLVDRGVE